MNERFRLKKTWIAGGAVAFAFALLAGGFLFGNSVQASSNPAPSETSAVFPITTLSTVKDDAHMPEIDNGAVDGHADNDVRVRWSGENWEYSSDGGVAWNKEAPEDVTVHKDGSLSLWQGSGDFDDYDIDTWEQGFDGWLSSILEDVDNTIRNVMPEGYEEWDSFVRYGDTIARQTDEGQWEYSADDGVTWTDKAPDGFSVNKDGTRFSIGGNGEDLEDIDLEGFLRSLWPEYYSETRATKTTSV